MKKALFSAACVVTCCLGNPAQASSCRSITDFNMQMACEEQESAIQQQQWEIQRLQNQIDSIEYRKALDEAFISY